MPSCGGHLKRSTRPLLSAHIGHIYNLRAPLSPPSDLSTSRLLQMSLILIKILRTRTSEGRLTSSHPDHLLKIPRDPDLKPLDSDGLKAVLFGDEEAPNPLATSPGC